METRAEYYYNIFTGAIHDYHIPDHIDAVMVNPYTGDMPESIFYIKTWIDTVQWHLEDVIRDPDIDSAYGLLIKRRIDELNQKRTDIVEQIDELFLQLFHEVVPQTGATHNTESLGWAFDRLSILSLKEYHVNIELNRNDISAVHMQKCLDRKRILSAQRADLIQSIDWLVDDIRAGKKINKVYKQLKMYNDQSFNPVLYSRKQQPIG